VSVIFLLGGARSGKSRLAVRLAAATEAPVVFVATGEAGDDEMAERIALHRAERPPHWQTMEAPRDLTGALADADGDACVVLDCLSLWVANVFEGEVDVEEDARTAAELAARRAGTTIAVSNEVGLGVVPATPLGRAYRDVLGRVNAIWADVADQAFFVVAGKALRLGDV
jgi:adenosylcobinamide kinase / adenosylcobinamide-phosphate guanylyltransferase